MADKLALTVVVLTKNEQDNIAECLNSVFGWTDEIIVVDDESSDKTREIANNFTDKVFIRKMDVEGIQRNWAYSQAKNEWVLSLDADEMVSAQLQEEISLVLKNNTMYNGFSIPLRNYIGNYWVKHSGWYPASKLRLFKKDKFQYEEVEVHPRAFLEGKESRLTKDIIHKGYPNLEHFFASLNRQTTLEAKKWITTNRHMSLGRAIWRTIDRFIRSFFVKKGYKDGFVGFMIAFFASLYQVISFVKYREMQSYLKGDD
ncbi:MAG: glycosyltransferase family 2 protein [Candidatus Omnitrophota bacterium]|nr:glycosyltransferase family 2 protein [Candidatus Omnitrophota bacterium]